MTVEEKKMQQIQLKTELRLKVPPNYICHHPLIDLYLRQVYGESLISLPPNAEMRSVGVFATQIDAPTISPFMVAPSKIFSEMDALFHLKTTSAPSFGEGLCLLDERIRCNEPVIVTGTTYELPHNPDYHSPHYFEMKPLGGVDEDGPSGGRFSVNDHYLAVIGISATEVMVYDALPQPMVVTLSQETFAKFWQGLAQFEIFAGAPGYDALVAHGITDVLLAPDYHTNSFRQTALHLLSRINRAYLEGRTRTSYGRRYLSGSTVNEHVSDYFKHQYAATGEAPRTLAKALFDMRWSRYYIRDFLLDLNHELRLPMQDVLTEIQAITTQWEEAYATFHGLTRRNPKISREQAQHFFGLLQAVSARELNWHAQLLEQMPSLV
jgi:hypothetical protein